MATSDKIQRIHSLLREYQNNFREVPVLHSMVTQLLREVDGLAPEAQATKKDYDSIISILPYNLWPSMV